jgi:signal transduction histidine kinase
MIFRPHLPRRTIRVRLTVLVFAVFLASGAALLVVTVAVWQGTTGESTRAEPVSIRVPPQRAIGITQYRSDRRQLLIASGISLAIMGGLSIALGWLVAGRFLEPLRTITTTAREISAANLHQRLNLAGPDDELKELGDTFDELLARLERSFAFERRFVANASHELRTPLTTMRASLDVAMAKPGPLPSQILTLADRLRHELDHVDRLLESFLALAHSQHGPTSDESRLSFDDLASAAVARHSAAISMLALTVDRQECAGACVTGSETLLTRMVENVIDNAVRHNHAGGWARIQSSVDESLACIVVENSGPVITQDELEHLTRPFGRPGSDKGSGLGLSIVASIADAHDGAVDLQPLSDGGLRVTITLPLAISTEAAPA